MYDAMWRVHGLDLGWWCTVGGGVCVCGGGFPYKHSSFFSHTFNDYLHITVLGVILPLNLQQKQYKQLV